MRLIVVIIETCASYQLHTAYYPNVISLTTNVGEDNVIFNVDFDAIPQNLIRWDIFYIRQIMEKECKYNGRILQLVVESL